METTKSFTDDESDSLIVNASYGKFVAYIEDDGNNGVCLTKTQAEDMSAWLLELASRAKIPVPTFSRGDFVRCGVVTGLISNAELRITKGQRYVTIINWDGETSTFQEKDTNMVYQL